MRSPHSIKGITVVGAGAVGNSLAASLFDAGLKIDFVCDADFERAGALAERTKTVALSCLDSRIFVSDVVLTAVPDHAVAAVAVEGAALCADISHQIWLHTAGALSASALLPVAQYVKGTGGFHPAAAFPPARRTKPVSGTIFGIDGNEAALDAAAILAAYLGGRTVKIPAESRPLYHATCVLSSNAVIGLVAEAARTLSTAGVPRFDAEHLLVTLARGALENAADLGLYAALTGPVQRGDVTTVFGHLNALEFQKDTANLYRITAKAILKIVRESKVLDETQLQQLEGIL